MGCSASKQQFNQTDKNVPPFPRSLSLPASSTKANGGTPSRHSWKPGSRTVDGQLHQPKSSSRLKPVREEDVLNSSYTDMAQHKVWEYIASSPERDIASRKHALSSRFTSTGSANEFKSNAAGSALGKGRGNENDGPTVKSEGDKPLCAHSRSSSFRVSEYMDGCTGLRVLLSPASTPLRSFSSLARRETFTTDLSPSCHYLLSANTETARPANKQASRLANKRTNQTVKVQPQVEEVGDSEEIGSPLFDPSILATFEKAIEASSDNIWLGSDATSSCSRTGGSSSDTNSDAESLYCHKESSVNCGMQQFLTRQFGNEDKLCKVGGGDLCYRSNSVPKKKPSAKVIPLHSDKWVSNEYLQGFDVKCPPGCEDKIVLYFTSLRGVRKTYEDCCTMRLILKGFGVQVDERDVWMHSSFRQELTNVVGAVLTVPRLFVRGRYIGGTEDVKHLHEEGILGYLLDGLPAESNNTCSVCAGIRFIPCTSCSGSCKLISLGKALRCPDCNENGLMMCPACH